MEDLEMYYMNRHINLLSVRDRPSFAVFYTQIIV